MISDSFLPFLTKYCRIKHWRKHGGAPPEGVKAVGQAAAIIRKATERRRGGFAGRGRFQPRGGGIGGGGRGGFGRGGGGQYGAPGQYGPPR